MKTKRFLSIVLTLAMVVGLMPGMSMTAYASTEKSETITTTVETISSTGAIVHGTYFTISNNGTMATKNGMAATKGITVSPKNTEYITKVVITCEYNSKNVSDANTTVSSGTKTITNGGGTITVTEVNANTFTFTCNNSGPFFNQFVVYYLDSSPAAAYSVTVNPGSNMTKTENSGETSQTGLSGAMTPVVYTANEGYYFPTDYNVAAVNGISVTRNSYTQITVSGTPTADATIILTAPTAKTTPDAPTTAAAVNCTTASNNDGKLTGVTAEMEYKKSDAESWTAGTSSDITGLVPGTYHVRVKATDTTNASANQELTIAEYTAPTYTVTYKVVNGTWSDDSTTDKAETVQSGSKPASVPTGMKASQGFTGGAWDENPADATITGAKTFTYTFTAIPTYTVTYKVVNGTWSDDSTTDKTETVQSGSKPASVPTGMKASQGFTGGAWDENPADATITGAKTFTYTFTAIPTYTVTYKVVNGTWSDDSTTDKTETVQSGSKPASVPTGMKASQGFTGGAWDENPADATITGAKTFTYTFTAKQASTVTKAPTAKNLTYTGSAQELVTAGEATGGEMQYALGTATEATQPYTTSIPTATDARTYYVWYKAVGSGNYKDSVPVCITVSIKEEDDSQNKGATDEKVEQHADTPETTVSGVSDELTDAVANSEEKAAVAAGSKATFTFELTNADNTVPAAEKQSLENVVRNEAPNAIVGMLLDLKAFFQVGNMPKRQLDTLNGKTVTFNFKVPEKLHAPAGIRRTFFILQNHEGKISILARTTATNIPFSAGDFSTYALAYSDENTDQEGFNTSIKIKQSEGKIKVSWDKVNGVSKVKVFATYCGKDYPSKPVKTTKGNSVTIKKLNGKKLNLKKNFKLYLVAYDKDGNKIGKTPSAHFAGKNSDKYTNPKSIKVSNKNVSVAVGANVKVKATIKLEDKKRKELPQKHAEKFRYRSTKNYIATVDKKGNIKGIAPGTCTVYVYAKNGLAKKVTVTVN